ncbi:MAG: hypothetical protein ABNG98_09305 [Flavobacterium sp.]|jgi:hypothetical protein
MKKKYIQIFFLSFSILAFPQVSGVGINETIPEQALHLGSSTGTIRTEGLDENNNQYNLGGTNTYPLYVDEFGDLTLYNETLYNSNGSDALTNGNINNAIVVIPNGDADGKEEVEIFNFSITVNRPSLLLIKYNVSFEVFETIDEKVIKDKLARRINTYFKLNGSKRKYSHVSKCYTSSGSNDVTGIFYNASSSYIIIPAAGTYIISMHGEVSSGIRSNDANTGLATCVKFGNGNDTMMYKLN